MNELYSLNLSVAVGIGIYIPKSESKLEWGAVSGSREFYSERNSRIRGLFYDGVPIEELAKKFGLSGSTIKKIIYRKK